MPSRGYRGPRRGGVRDREEEYEPPKRYNPPSMRRGRRGRYGRPVEKRAENDVEEMKKDIEEQPYQFVSPYFRNLLAQGARYRGSVSSYPWVSDYFMRMNEAGRQYRENVSPYFAGGRYGAGLRQQGRFPNREEFLGLRANVTPGSYGQPGRYGRAIRAQSYVPTEWQAYQPWLEGYADTVGGGGGGGQYAGYGGYGGYGYPYGYGGGGGRGGGGGYTQYPRQTTQARPQARYGGGQNFPAGNYAQRPVTPRWYQNLITWTI